MGVIRIDIEKPTQEFEIGGEIYTARWDDDTLLELERKFAKYNEMAMQSSKLDVSKLSYEEQQRIRTEQLKVIEELLDTLFGEGSYKKIYESTHRSMVNLGKVIEVVMEFVVEKIQLKKQSAREKYVKK
mgnify:CR=1 FL=1